MKRGGQALVDHMKQMIEYSKLTDPEHIHPEEICLDSQAETRYSVDIVLLSDFTLYLGVGFHAIRDISRWIQFHCGVIPRDVPS